MEFKNLHQQNDPLLICNVWDVPSTKIAEKLNFQAIGTSSFAIAKMLGYEDGEKLSFPELEYIVKRIAANTKLPLSVDLESGYSRDYLEISDHIKRLAGLGVVGINIEDSIVDTERTFIEPEQFSKTLSLVRNQLEKDSIKIFINVRTDTFLLGHSNPVEETKKRIKLYENAGADGIFVPCVEKEPDIKAIVESTALPINVLCMPNLPNFDKLMKLGVKRISMGNFIFDNMYKDFESMLNLVSVQKSFNSVF